MKKKLKQIESASFYFSKLLEEFPDPKCALNFETPFQLLIATILSAQCTDIQVNIVTRELFKKYPNSKLLSEAKEEEIEKIIFSTGFYKNKSKNIVSCARQIENKYGGDVPDVMEDLVQLSGVGRKTANVVLSNAFMINIGVVVDTHVQRISQRLELTKHENVEKIEKDLMELFPKKSWGILSHLLILHGRKTCIARKPKCEICSLKSKCPTFTKKSE